MDAVEEENVQPSLSQTFREARQAKDWSEEEVAKRLNITLAQLQKLESDALQLNTITPFERGYLRNYAQLVEIDLTPYEADFPHSDSVSSDLKSMERYRYPAPKPVFRGGFLRWVLVIVILLVGFMLAAMVWPI